MLAEITVIVQDGLPEVLVALSVFLDELARGALGISDAVVGTVSVGPVQVVLLLEVGVGVEADIIAVQHRRRESLQAGGQGAEIVGQGSLALELLLVVLSSVAQQEVENISSNVKKGLAMKMSRGEIVGFAGALGYDYDPETKTISVNEEEAKVVRYIFKRYIEGMGAHVIARELEQMGALTNRGNKSWYDSTVLGIIKNEKYKGDLLQGKTFTVDPITKRRLGITWERLTSI